MYSTSNFVGIFCDVYVNGQGFVRRVFRIDRCVYANWLARDCFMSSGQKFCVHVLFC